MNRFFTYKIDHAIFWIATVLFYVFTRTSLIATMGFGQFLLDVIIRNGLLAMVIYFHLLYLMPGFLAKGKYMQYTVGLLLSITFYVLIKNWHDGYLQNQMLSVNIDNYYWRNSYYNFSILSFYFLFSLALALSKEWYLQRELLRQAQLEKMNAELAYLRAQTNPHFIFNTINTIYFQIDKKNGAARETLMLFSNMLRYQLYDCNEDFIAIEKEAASLESYVALQKLRKDNRYKVDFICHPSVRNFAIAPLLLLPFVENAFKYVSSFTDSENSVQIEMKKEGDIFFFAVVNTFDKSDSLVSQHIGGIGLKNVKRRLHLLYSDRHELNITEDGQTFKVGLKIDL